MEHKNNDGLDQREKILQAIDLLSNYYGCGFYELGLIENLLVKLSDNPEILEQFIKELEGFRFLGE